MALTDTELETRLSFIEKQLIDLNNIIQGLLPKIQQKQFSLFVEEALTAYNTRITAMEQQINNIVSTFNS